MRHIKNVIIFAAFGFLLSFVFGICSHLHFLSVLLKAFIIAIAFGALGFVVSFVGTKFLFGEEGSDGDVDISTISNSRGENGSKGSVVNITIRDEELPVSNSDNHFVVGDNHQMLYESDIGSTIPQKQAQFSIPKTDQEKDSSFVPIRTKENPLNVSGKEAITPDSIRVSSENQIHDYEDNKGNDTIFRKQQPNNDIDTLPEITGFSDPGDKVDSSQEEEESSDVDVGSDSDNFENTPTSKKSSGSGDAGMEIKDATLYAKAISSILSGEEN